MKKLTRGLTQIKNTAHHLGQTPKKSRGFTLVEIIIVAGIGVVVGLVLVKLFSSSTLFIGRTQARQALEAEIADGTDLLSRLVRSADAGSLMLLNTDDGPWSRLEFVSSGKHYAFYANGNRWEFLEEGRQPKVLSTHLRWLQFVLPHSTDPSLLAYAVELEPPFQKSPGDRVIRSATVSIASHG